MRFARGFKTYKSMKPLNSDVAEAIITITSIAMAMISLITYYILIQ